MTGGGGRLFHVALVSEWEAARAVGRYERSTRGRSLDEVGFVHLSTADQWPGVLERFYSGAGELVLLEVDPARLESPLRWESVGPEGGELFPHLYGPLPVSAVVGVRALDPR